MALADFSETKNWNTAKHYSERKIMKHLANIDKYIEICNFGTETMEDEFRVDPKMVAYARIKALKRLGKSIEMLARNCSFALKKADKKKAQSIKQACINLHPLADETYKDIKDERNNHKKIIIYEKTFQQVLNLYVKFAEDLNEPLNRANLIFSSTEEFDPDEYKRQVKEQFTHGG